ncbi:MAG: hypothetical protein Unbinned3459contig1000_61 [Prokaryotic dsDNA virus sp.]|jgi:hypothetical protein|nr:MAG: hypothetical protein Unbinned3459contig1000_61 [Prokaryotic dsDNA virus sp.]|tara:strand:+ start:614 stop:811 length:198 start_codon:yes stop_codon:yes gene_type:complete
MINNDLVSDFEDIICGATEMFTAQEIYDALNEAIVKQIAWHNAELRTLLDLQWLVTGASKDQTDH